MHDNVNKDKRQVMGQKKVSVTYIIGKGVI